MPPRAKAPATPATPATGEIASSPKLAELRERAASLPWDPDHLRAFLVDLVDAVSPPAEVNE